MKITIHIGAEKTGSTSIQHFLDENRKKLSKQNISLLYRAGKFNNRKLPAYCMSESKTDSFTRNHNIDNEDSRLLWKENFKKDLVSELIQTKKRFNHLLVTSEHFQSRLSSKEEVLKLKELLTPYATEFQIIAYLRRQDRAAISRDSTICRSGGIPGELLDKNIKSENLFYNYHNFLNNWESVFGINNISLRVYDDIVMNKKSIISDFAVTAGIESGDKMKMPKKLNSKLSSESRDIIIWFDKQHSNSNAIELTFRKFILDELELIYNGPEALPSKQDALRFYAQFEESNKKVAKRYFNKRTLFDQDFNKYPEKEKCRMGEDEICELIDALKVRFKSDFFIRKKMPSKYVIYYLYLIFFKKVKFQSSRSY